MNKKRFENVSIGLIGIILSLISFLARIDLDLIMYIFILILFTILYSKIFMISRKKKYAEECLDGRKIVFAFIIDYIFSFLIFVIGLLFVGKSKYISVSLIYNSFLYFYTRNVLFQSVGFKIMNICVCQISMKKKIILLIENVFFCSPITMFIISTNLRSNLFETIMELLGIIWILYIFYWIIKKKTLLQKIYGIKVYRINVNLTGENIVSK